MGDFVDIDGGAVAVAVMIELDLFGEPCVVNFTKAFDAEGLEASSFGIDPLDFEEHGHLFFDPDAEMIGVVGDGNLK